jgi:hypothetical protein
VKNPLVGLLYRRLSFDNSDFRFFSNLVPFNYLMRMRFRRSLFGLADDVFVFFYSFFSHIISFFKGTITDKSFNH